MKNTPWRGYFARFFPHDFLWPFQFFNNLLAEVQLSITPQQRSGKISISCSQKQKWDFCWPTLFHSTLGNSKAASWRRIAGLESQWIRCFIATTGNRCLKFSAIEEPMRGKNALSAGEQRGKWLQRPVACWDVQVKPWRRHRERLERPKFGNRLWTTAIAWRLAKGFHIINTRCYCYYCFSVVRRIKPSSSLLPYLIIESRENPSCDHEGLTSHFLQQILKECLRIYKEHKEGI